MMIKPLYIVLVLVFAPTITAQAITGTVCSKDAACLALKSGMYCSSDKDSVHVGTCQPMHALGLECIRNGECLSDACRDPANITSTTIDCGRESIMHLEPCICVSIGPSVPTTTEKENGLNVKAGAIAGIVLVCMVAFAVSGGAFLAYLKWRKKNLIKKRGERLVDKTEDYSELGIVAPPRASR